MMQNASEGVTGVRFMHRGSSLGPKIEKNAQN